jgi:hypothetical protein
VSYRAGLAQALFEEGQREAARTEYRELMRQDPGWLGRTGKAAWALATHPDPRARSGEQALRFANQACQAARGQPLELLDTLAAAQAEAGLFDQAAATARAALARAAAAHKPAAALGELRRRLESYEARQPFRDAAGRGPVKEKDEG